ncbi:MAG: sterol desaturase family protein [Actinomycetota bacterium]
MIENLNGVTALFEAVFVPLILIELLVLRRARRLGWARIKEMLANGAGYLFLYLPAGIVGVALWIRVFDAVAEAVPWSVPTNWWTIPVAIVVADFVYYWEHRVSHEKRVLWDLYHSVHHSSEQFDQSTNLRLGVFDGMLTLVFSLPMVVVGFSPGLVLAATALVLGYQTWIHTEVIDRMPRWFEAVFNTPSHHRGHHGAERPYLDVNYGGILIVWDRLFGTFQPELDTPVYGLTTQIESSNPIDIQFSQLWLLIRDLRADRSWRTRWARLWNRPGWQVPTAADPEWVADETGRR